MRNADQKRSFFGLDREVASESRKSLWETRGETLQRGKGNSSSVRTLEHFRLRRARRAGASKSLQVNRVGVRTLDLDIRHDGTRVYLFLSLWSDLPSFALPRWKQLGSWLGGYGVKCRLVGSTTPSKSAALALSGAVLDVACGDRSRKLCDSQPCKQRGRASDRARDCCSPLRTSTLLPSIPLGLCSHLASSVRRSPQCTRLPVGLDHRPRSLRPHDPSTNVHTPTLSPPSEGTLF